MSTETERLSLLEKAHRGHRSELASMRSEIHYLRRIVGAEPTVSGRGDLSTRVNRLENGGLNWTTGEAKELLAKMTRLREALDDIFGDTP